MRLAEDVAELGGIEQAPQQDGRNMTMLLAPLKRKQPIEAAAGLTARAGARRAGSAGGAAGRPRASASIGRSHAEDEDPLRRQEALPQDGQRQAARAALLHEPLPRQEARQAQAPAGPCRSRRTAGPTSRAVTEPLHKMSRVKRSVHARKKRRADPRADQGLPRPGQVELQARQRRRCSRRLLRLPRPPQPQARLPPPLDHPHQRRGAQGGASRTASSCTAWGRRASSSTARCWRISPCATPRRSDVLPSEREAGLPRPPRPRTAEGASRDRALGRPSAPLVAHSAEPSTGTA